MGRYSKKSKPSPETREEAMRIARANQRPGQTKEQTRLIAQGIQKGIDQYKKQQKAKAREVDRLRSRQSRDKDRKVHPGKQTTAEIRYRQHWLPWLLLAITWIAIALYLILLGVPS